MEKQVKLIYTIAVLYKNLRWTPKNKNKISNLKKL